MERFRIQRTVQHVYVGEGESVSIFRMCVRKIAKETKRGRITEKHGTK